MQPVKLEQNSATDFSIHWEDGHISKYHSADLRRACACASCVNEWTGEKQLDDKKVPEDIHPVNIRPAGNYALHIQWSDGHATGFYSFEMLRKL
ncbi:MAG: hypothetical protein COV45_06475 [Deltaproteobacteria bacterium CG11_big_fil_rev_8_21_14_0_20_47_16]|nr:MAG: hypothetical protein COV45_06475 [Deltaproteobacteria bacterium CG11_big_fil_rev_8_21_14_0_20_47_16]